MNHLDRYYRSKSGRSPDFVLAKLRNSRWEGPLAERTCACSLAYGEIIILVIMR